MNYISHLGLNIYLWKGTEYGIFWEFGSKFWPVDANSSFFCFRNKDFGPHLVLKKKDDILEKCIVHVQEPIRSDILLDILESNQHFWTKFFTENENISSNNVTMDSSFTSTTYE